MLLIKRFLQETFLIDFKMLNLWAMSVQIFYNIAATFGLFSDCISNLQINGHHVETPKTKHETGRIFVLKILQDNMVIWNQRIGYFSFCLRIFFFYTFFTSHLHDYMKISV